MLSVSYAGKNAYSAGKTSGDLRGGASGANRCYVLAHCGGGHRNAQVGGGHRNAQGVDTETHKCDSLTDSQKDVHIEVVPT